MEGSQPIPSQWSPKTISLLIPAPTPCPSPTISCMCDKRKSRPRFGIYADVPYFHANLYAWFCAFDLQLHGGLLLFSINKSQQFLSHAISLTSRHRHGHHPRPRHRHCHRLVWRTTKPLSVSIFALVSFTFVFPFSGCLYMSQEKRRIQPSSLRWSRLLTARPRCHLFLDASKNQRKAHERQS